jgi:hypothetical protein
MVAANRVDRGWKPERLSTVTDRLSLVASTDPRSIAKPGAKRIDPHHEVVTFDPGIDEVIGAYIEGPTTLAAGAL